MGATEHSAPLLQNRRSPRGAASLEGKWKAGGRASTTVRLPPSTRARQGRPGQGRTPSAVRHKRNPGTRPRGTLFSPRSLLGAVASVLRPAASAVVASVRPRSRAVTAVVPRRDVRQGLTAKSCQVPGTPFEFVVAAVVELEARSGDEHLIRDPILPDPREPRRRNLAPCDEPHCCRPAASAAPARPTGQLVLTYGDQPLPRWSHALGRSRA